MKPIHLIVIVCALIGSAAAVAQVPSGEVEQQVPVKEQVEAIDAPSADAAKGNAAANMPAVGSPPTSEGEGAPPPEAPPDVQQPPVEP